VAAGGDQHSHFSDCTGSKPTQAKTSRQVHKMSRQIGKRGQEGENLSEGGKGVQISSLVAFGSREEKSSYSGRWSLKRYNRKTCGPLLVRKKACGYPERIGNDS